jgi:hypothetical protein
MRALMLSCLAASLCLLATRPLRAQANDLVRINGYTSVEFEKMLGDEGRGDANGSFDADGFDLVLNFTPSHRLRVAADLTWEHGPATEDGRGNVAVEYAFPEYYASDLLKVRAGKMFTHFGIYNEIHTAKPAFLTVKEPLSTNKNEKFGSDLRFYPRWTNGVALLGTGKLGRGDFDYVVQVGNGEQSDSNPFEEDDNGAKAFGGRFQFMPRLGITAGVSFYTDRLAEVGDLEDLAGGPARLVSYGGHAFWSRRGLGLEAEYVRGYVDPDEGARVTRHALTAMAFYRIQDRVTPYLRYEWLDPDLARPDDRAWQYVYGVNVRLTQGLFVKAELDTVRSGQANRRFEGVGYTEFKSSFAAGF